MLFRSTKQVDAAYESGDFKTAEKLDAQREQLVDDWDNKFEQMDEGDGNVDLEEDDPHGDPNEDLEPDHTLAAASPSEQVRDAYRRYLNGEMEGARDYVGGHLEPLPPGQPPFQRQTGGEWVASTPERELAKTVRSAVAGEGFTATEIGRAHV